MSLHKGFWYKFSLWAAYDTVWLCNKHVDKELNTAALEETDMTITTRIDAAFFRNVSFGDFTGGQKLHFLSTV